MDKINKIILVAVYLLLSVSGQLLVKIGSQTTSVSLKEKTLLLNLNIYLVVGLVLYVASFFSFIVIISRFDLGKIMPILVGLSYSLLIFASAVVLKEEFRQNQLIGIIIILVGLIIMQIKNFGNG